MRYQAFGVHATLVSFAETSDAPFGGIYAGQNSFFDSPRMAP